jgi:vacuolar-type H+-ATPase subunit E/Vma4
MARTALIESLRSQASRDAQALWDAARAEARRRQDELDEALAQEQRRLDGMLAAEARRIETQASADAAHKAREANAATAVALAERLLALARAELPALAAGSRAELFDALAPELPPCRWQCVRVNPADAELAALRFPGAAVETDPAISGGMEVACDEGRIAVSNTLETRLVIAWPDLLPGLLADLAARGRDHGTAA